MKWICPLCKLEMKLKFSSGDGRLSRHHIICRSREGKDNDKNIVLISHLEHYNFHQLFANRTPEEILDYLVNTFWGKDKSIIKDYCRKR